MNLSGLPLEELAELIAPLPRYRVAQIIKWLSLGVSSFSVMSNLPLPLREDLSRRFTLRPETTHTIFRGEDGTVKIKICFSDGAEIEAVLLADEQESAAGVRYTICLSTQAGCPAGCVFCKTGTKFLRNLDSSEIIEQFFLLREVSLIPISNIVVMGMGEPLLNLPELRRALAVITCPQGINFSKKRITVSTCGIVNGINDLTDNGPIVRLAFSMTTADENLRRQLMPVSAGQPLSGIKKALRYYQEKSGERITLELVLLGGINTRCEDAAAAAKFAKGLDAVVNLIPWNPVNGLEFQGKKLRQPSVSEVESFARRLKSHGIKVTRRFRRGRSILGACGQLGT